MYTNNDVEDIIEKFKEYGIIKYEVDNIIEFVDKKVIEQFKKINQLLNADALENYRKECTNKISL